MTPPTVALAAGVTIRANVSFHLKSVQPIQRFSIRLFCAVNMMNAAEWTLPALGERKMN